MKTLDIMEKLFEKEKKKKSGSFSQLWAPVDHLYQNTCSSALICIHWKFSLNLNWKRLAPVERDLVFQDAKPVSNKHSACFVPPCLTSFLVECSFVLSKKNQQKKKEKSFTHIFILD